MNVHDFLQRVAAEEDRWDDERRPEWTLPDPSEWEPEELHPRGRYKRGPRTFCAQGHALTPENTYVRPGDGHRACRICKRNWEMARRESAA